MTSNGTDIEAADPAAQHPLLVTTEWLARHFDDPRLVLIDMSEPVAYERAHIRGAVGVPHAWLKGRDTPLEVMPPAEFEALARRQGISSDSVVIVYDDHLNRAATRGWWALERYGFEGARILDGGLHAWIAEGRPVTQELPTPAPGTFTARPVDDLTCSLQDMRDAIHPAAGVQLWDVRTDAEWEGTNTNNQRHGRIPGAVHLEWRNFVDDTPSHHFVPLAEARRLLEAAGVKPDVMTVTYCQAGIRASLAAFVLRLLDNRQVSIYDASMAEWANREDTPLV